jgi:hypothetical protein
LESLDILTNNITLDDSNPNTNSDNLQNDDQIMKDIIISLCEKYKFKYQFINDIVFIYSIIDEWYFSYSKNVFCLYHKNKLHATKQYHFQKKFNNIIHILQYIRKHDNFYYRPKVNKCRATTCKCNKK